MPSNTNNTNIITTFNNSKPNRNVISTSSSNTSTLAVSTNTRSITRDSTNDTNPNLLSLRCNLQ